ncbi:biotin--[acetyl-CoA-carboxylase] ligase [Ruania alba]|uniref:biotin--[biotin carboxyl-carrier protein] ligase n=1 Tax=Ruania alba TaxID=648782 RepID=A0A1H5N836_9MICO|nr:biotin--[acetyl-CoA-carboxylase] ligase [Ruania alba]SEE97782.1 BirA family transcriptional regulator, biotin operon repressor / biotin-[acetyl-CoA-carboxylase] ligase [Ruania alba]
MAIRPLEIVDDVGSTNAELLARAGANPDDWPHLSALLARRQHAGKGRSGRTWSTDEHSALTFSILVRPGRPTQDWGWLPLLAGDAVVQVLRAEGTHEVPCGLKWPNDVVHLGGTQVLPEWGCLRKVGGLLAEVLPDASGVVLGIGINLDGADLPVPWAGTAAQLGVTAPAERLAEAIRDQLAELLTHWEAGADPHGVVAPACLTLGTQVRIDLPEGAVLEGEALDLEPDGSLRVRTHDGNEQVVLAGDVTHVRAG